MKPTAIYRGFPNASPPSSPSREKTDVERQRERGGRARRLRSRSKSGRVRPPVAAEAKATQYKYVV